MKKEGKKKQRERKKLLQNTRDQIAIFVSDWLIIVFVFKQITDQTNHRVMEKQRNITLFLGSINVINSTV